MEKDPTTLFIENLMTEAGLTDLPADYRKEYIAKIQDQLNQRLGLIVVKNLDDAGAQEFKTLIDSDAGPDEIQKFFANKIPGMEEIIKQDMALFAQQFLSAVKK